MMWKIEVTKIGQNNPLGNSFGRLRGGPQEVEEDFGEKAARFVGNYTGHRS